MASISNLSAADAPFSLAATIIFAATGVYITVEYTVKFEYLVTNLFFFHCVEQSAQMLGESL
jgi:hypothetical protein